MYFTCIWPDCASGAQVQRTGDGPLWLPGLKGREGTTQPHQNLLSPVKNTLIPNSKYFSEKSCHVKKMSKAKQHLIV